VEQEEWDVYNAPNGQLPRIEELAQYDGLVLTGSHYSVLDKDLPWLQQLFAVIRYCVDNESAPRIVGGCFGCQAIAVALGGRVAKNPNGSFVFAAEKIVLNDSLISKDFSSGLAQQSDVYLLESHGDCVLELPSQAQVLGHSKSAPYEIFTVGDRALAIQSHPEFTPELMEQKILPALRLSGKLSKEDARKSVASFTCKYIPSGSAWALALIRSCVLGGGQEGSTPRLCIRKVADIDI
jgi:GMP synthase (glutamine-hydrolysing)